MHDEVWLSQSRHAALTLRPRPDRIKFRWVRPIRFPLFGFHFVCGLISFSRAFGIAQYLVRTDRSR